MSTIKRQSFTSRSASTFVLNIATSSINPDIRALAVTAGWNQFDPLECRITAPLINRLRITQSFNRGLVLYISPNTLIGSRAVPDDVALYVSVAVAVENRGKIYGAGGTGGTGGRAGVSYLGVGTTSYGGTGGAGQGFGGDSLSILGPYNGYSNGCATHPGPSWAGETDPTVCGGVGGAGGVWGVSGNQGSWGSGYGTGSFAYSPPDPGGLPGFAVSGEANITWVERGDLRGRIRA